MSASGVSGKKRNDIAAIVTNEKTINKEVVPNPYTEYPLIANISPIDVDNVNDVSIAPR